MVGKLSSVRQRKMLSVARNLLIGGGAMLLCAATPASVQGDQPDLGTFVLAGLGDVCVPVIERGDSLSEIASAAGFLEVTGDNRAALGGSKGMSWWLFEFAEAVLVVGRDLDEPGSACQVAASVPVARAGAIERDVGIWAAAAKPAFQQVVTPSSPGRARDAQWMWQRSAGGTVQQLRLSLTRHGDGTATSTLQYGLLPPQSR